MQPPRCSIALLLGSLALGGCATARQDLAPPTSPLQLREAQSRTYSSCDRKLVMRAVLATLQDEGFVVRGADAELGLVTASKESARPVSAGQRVLGWYTRMLTYGLVSGPTSRSALLEATANVSEFGAETRVRISFQLKILEGPEGLKESTTVTDPVAYQEFLAKLDKALFLLKEKL
jgi:hypothetical protein